MFAKLQGRPRGSPFGDFSGLCYFSQFSRNHCLDFLHTHKAFASIEGDLKIFRHYANCQKILNLRVTCLIIFSPVGLMGVFSITEELTYRFFDTVGFLTPSFINVFSLKKKTFCELEVSFSAQIFSKKKVCSWGKTVFESHGYFSALYIQ